ncbi:TlpA disulfide reductase family protein [Bradyrhizobium sp.]|uniref:TlpA disulfide reductase family protein n=1 Tax=Bradyrhizobium sp. TaxID=376 RepID=UPI00359F71E2
MFSKEAPACRGTSSRQPNAARTVVALFAATLWLASSLNSSALEFESRQGPPQSFVLQSVDARTVDLRSLHGRIVIVHFFATWCEPCREELPALQRLAARLNPQSVEIVAISVAEVELRVRRFLEAMPVSFPVLLDQDRAVAKAWNISTLPSTIIIDSDLRPRLMVEHDISWDRLDPKQIVEMIDGDPAGNDATTKH